MYDNFKIIKTEKELDKLIKYCQQTGYASIDFETSGHDWHSPLGYPTILGVSFQPGSAWVIPLGHFDSPFKDNWEYYLGKFSKAVIENKEVVKMAHNVKFEMKWFTKYGYEIKGIIIDTMLAKYLLDEEKPMGLKPLVDRFIPQYMGYSEKYEGSHLPWDKKPLEPLSMYCALDCDLTFRLAMFLESQLIRNDLYPLFRNLIMMAARVLDESEYYGMPVDREYLEGLIVRYETMISDKLNALQNNKYVKSVEKHLNRERLSKYIGAIEEEVHDLKVERKKLKKELKSIKHKTKPKHLEKQKLLNRNISAITRKIANRNSKIERLSAGELTTKGELKLIEPLNFSSPAQMIQLLYQSKKGFKFKVIRYTVDKKTKEESNTPSTDESVLLELKKKDKTGFIQNLLDYRGLTKLFSTYIKGIHEKLSVEDKVHTRYLIEGTVTGRLSSQQPNLQNVPRDTTAADIKKMFVPPPGYLLLQADYSQAELRVMAAMAKEENMLTWFREGRDIHLAVALKKNGMEDQYDRVLEILDKDDGSEECIHWKKERKYAKTINFGIIYGQGANKLSESLECSKEEAQEFLKEYFKLFPKIKKFIQKQHRLAHEQGHVRSLFGRKRRLPKIDSDKTFEVAEAERQSVNAPIQGAASDYALFSSVLVWELRRKNKINIELPQAYTVHDSLGYWVKPEHVHEVVKQLTKICANPETKEWFGFQINSVQMQVDFEVSHSSWGELRKYNPKTDYVKVMRDSEVNNS